MQMRNDNEIKTEWKCPGVDTHFLPEEVYEKSLDILNSSQELLKVLPLIAEHNKEDYMLLPVIQNQEACVFGAQMSKKAGYWAPGDYPFSTPKDLLMHLNECKTGFLREDVRSKAVIEAIRGINGRNVILEAEAPFSILTALVPPEKVYALLRRERQDDIVVILDRIVEELILYLQAAVEAGCRIISVADPLGKYALCGPRIYKNWIAPWERKLLKKSYDYLEQALIHLCGNMAMDLIRTGSAYTMQIPFDHKRTYTDNLYQIAEDPSVRYVGPGCLRNCKETIVGHKLILNAEE